MSKIIKTNLHKFVKNDIFTKRIKQIDEYFFFDDKLIKLTTKVEFEDGFKNYLLKSFVLEDILHELKKTSLSEVRLIGEDESSLCKGFLKKLN